MPTTLEQQREQLAHVRRLNTAPDLSRSQTVPYRRAEILLREGILLDPKRPVASEWERTPYDNGRTMMRYVPSDKGYRIDAGDGPGVTVGGKHKVRVLRGPQAGAVKEVSSLDYYLIRCAATGVANPSNLEHEPVPSDTPLCGPLLPANMPSNFGKAKRLAAAGLKKPEGELTAPEVIKFFEQKKATPLPVVKADERISS